MSKLCYAEFARLMINDENLRRDVIKAGNEPADIMDVLDSYGIESDQDIAKAMASYNYGPAKAVQEAFDAFGVDCESFFC